MAEKRENIARSKNVFGEELELLKSSRSFLKNESITLAECKDELTHLQKSYDELLDQTKLITKVSDRLQSKINKSNEELEGKNIELQESLDALTRAKLSRKANTITLIVVFALFMLTEALVEPWMEESVAIYFKGGTFLFLILSAKAVVALMLRPIEKLVEKYLYRKEQEKFAYAKAERENI